MTEIKESKAIDVCVADIVKVDDDTLVAVMGGVWDVNNALAYKYNYEHPYYEHKKPDYAAGYCENADMELVEKEYPCPVCGSWSVRNYDPGIFRMMRVVCYHCGAFKCRNGDDPWTIS